jgi:DNA-binding GntR family transcriptional regulator
MNTVPASGLATEIASALESDIKLGRLLPGQPLDERVLAERFGVSRTPVRAAVQQLAARGLIRVLPRQGLRVAQVSIAELREMFEVLAELEGACAKLAARRMDEPWRARLIEAAEHCRQAAEAGDPAAYEKGNTEFHAALYEGCRNRYLASQIREIRARTSLYTVSVFQLPGRMRQSAEDHLKILDAVIQGDWVAAQREMVDHISIGGVGFAEFISLLPPGLLDGSEAAHPAP